MKKNKIISALVVALLLLLTFATVTASAYEPYTTYTYSSDGLPLPSPAVYVPMKAGGYIDSAKMRERGIVDFEDIALKSVRILSNNALEELKLTTRSLLEMKDFIDTYEAEHESNLSRPIGAKNKPVAIPMTSDMSKNIENMLEIAEKAILGLEIAEFATLEEHDEVKSYVVRIA